ncbi:hypothetical protein IFM89_024756, partial [Coptis chinensis]
SLPQDEISPTPANGKKKKPPIEFQYFTISEDVKLCESWLTIREDGIVVSIETKSKPKTSSKKIQGEGSSNVNDSQTPICLDEDVNASTMMTSELIQPDDMKKQKERKRRASEAAKVVEGFVNRVELRMEKQDKLLETQLQSKDRDQELKNKKIEAMERREEAKIMAMDLLVLLDFRREYFEAKQDEIYKRWKGGN